MVGDALRMFARALKKRIFASEGIFYYDFKKINSGKSSKQYDI